jgi:serine/threonine protein kinase
MQNYQLGEKIGQGGMGLVYKAHDPGLDRDVAIKFMDEALANDAVCVERFLREARLLAKIDNPNVVRVLGAGKDERDRPYFVMELLQGISLSERIRNGPLPEAEAVEIACQTLGALSEAHSHGIIHRDIKASNILLCSGGRVKLIDFGIARDEVASSVTSTGKVIGTPSYMSPEQAMGEKASPQSDIYSLGIVMYEMLVGHVPFRSETPVAVLRMHTDHPPPALPGFLSPKLRSVVAWALEKRPERRFKTADAMLNELRSTVSSAPKTPAKGTPKQQIFAPKSDPKVGTASGKKGVLVPALLVVFVLAAFGIAWMSGAFGGVSASNDSGSATSIASEEPKPASSAAVPTEVETAKKTKDIPFKTLTRNTSSLAKGKSRVQAEGRNGTLEITYEVSSGKEVSRRVVESSQDRIVLVGTKSAIPPVVPKKTNCPRCGARKPNRFCGVCGYPGPDARGA